MDVRDPVRPGPARGLLEVLAGERRAEPALARHAQVGGEHGRNRVPVVHLDRQRVVHVCTRPAATQVTVTLSARTTYYWQVRAVNGAGTTDANGGTWWSFRTK